MTFRAKPHLLDRHNLKECDQNFENSQAAKNLIKTPWRVATFQNSYYVTLINFFKSTVCSMLTEGLLFITAISSGKDMVLV